MRYFIALIGLTVVTGILGCKARQEQSAVMADATAPAEKPVDPAAKEAVQAVAVACGSDTASQFRGSSGDHVDFVPVYVAPVAGKDHEDFFESATFTDGKWKLSTGMRDPKTPECVAGRLELSTEELIGALRCAGVDPCRGIAKPSQGPCKIEAGQVVAGYDRGVSGVAFTDLESCGDLMVSEQGILGFAEFAAAPPPKGETRALPRGDQPESAMALTANSFAWAPYGDAARAFHLTKTNYSGQLEFKPDTLYSWGPFAKLNWLASHGWSGKLRRDYKDAPIFATTSPFGSFGYGDISVRLKIKTEGVRYKFISEYPFRSGRAREYCDDNDVDVDSTIIVRYWDNGIVTGLDYILCGLGPVHSWSWGTQEQYAEMNAEVTWMGQHNYRDYELYVKRGGVDEMYPAVDGNSPSAQKWQNNMSYHYTRGFGAASHAGNRGLIYYNPGVSNGDQVSHFRTNSPVYFNPE